MKKLIALILTLTLAMALCACGASAEETTQTTAAPGEGTAPRGPPPDRSFSVLSLLNMTEEEYLALISVRGLINERMGIRRPLEGVPEGQLPEGAPEDRPQLENKVIFYDTLDALLMALNAGDIQNIEIYESVARYLCATNDNLEIGPSFDFSKTSETFAELVQNGINGNDFAFLMMEGNAALRDEFNAAISAMKADGTLDRLVKEQIDDLVNGGEIAPIELPKIDGAETIKVAVTGALLPMDYVAEDGNLLPFEDGAATHVLSYDEKPGIQAIANTSEDKPPNENNGVIKRDYEYKRLGTISLLAGIDLQTGEAIPLISNTHNSDDYIAFLQNL